MRPSVAAAATRRSPAVDSHVPLSDELEERVAARNRSLSPRERQVTMQLRAQAVARVKALGEEATRRTLPELMSKEQLSKPQSTINAAALQVALGIVLCS